MLLLNAAATLFMTGLIWFVQVVHYPLFAAVGSAEFARYGARHADTTLVVLVPMLTELVTACLLVWHRPPSLGAREVWLGAALVGMVWLSTAFLQVPRHGELARGFDASAHAALVTTNWLRTAAWTLRSGLVLRWLAGVTG